ncbi:MAG: methyltransferase [Syntrophus sp. (in: bacteria)]|nr:methyltransferase [Syntrophus sp. (in: bacteria)]MBA4419081.1 methyltransferase [Syntrophus sp. (in: bacteria)]
MGRIIASIVAVIIGIMAVSVSHGQQTLNPPGLDAHVSRFLNNTRGSWNYLNVPYEDGKILYDLVLKGNFKHILEIGTSTGHSTIWLAWAAARTGGRVTTIEIDKERHEAALENFKKAGVAQYIDARLGDAHDLVPAMKGPFDFVFCDADKDWYIKYFRDLRGKINLNGCFTAHNVLGWNSDGKRFVEYIKRDSKFTTYIEQGSGEGISVSCRITK